MKVLYVAPDFPNKSINAAQVRANQLLPRLNKKIDLYVLGFCNYSHEEFIDTKIKIENIKPGKINIKSMVSRRPRAFVRYRFRESVELLNTMIKDFEPDIIHFDSIATYGLFESLFMNNLVRRPKSVFHSHDSVTRLYNNQYRYENNLIRRFDLFLQLNKIRSFEKNIYPKADLCIVDSREDAVFLRNLSDHTTIDVVPLGFDENEYCVEGASAKLSHPSIVFTGSMGGPQSIEAAIYLCREVMPNVWNLVPQAEVYLVGGNPAPEVYALQEYDSRIHVTGFVDSISDYLRGSDVYACPLRLGSGMRTRVIEALACGCAMVATPEAIVGLNKPLDSETWLLAEDVSEFSNHIIHLLSDENRRKRIGQQAAIFAESYYSWSSVTDKLIECYQRII